MKKYTYGVNGKIFTDTTAFGKAWENAVTEAKTSQETITRRVVEDKKQKFEFLAKGKVFLDIKFYDEKRVYKF